MPSKTIRVKEDTWTRLEQERDWRESFDTVISRLLNVHDMIRGVEPLLKGSKAFNDFRAAAGKETPLP